MIVVRYETSHGVVVAEVEGDVWSVSQDGKMVEIYRKVRGKNYTKQYMAFNLDFVISVELQEDENGSETT